MGHWRENHYAFTLKGCDKWLVLPQGEWELPHDKLTNTEDIEAEAMVDGFVDQLVWHAVEANMT